MLVKRATCTPAVIIVWEHALMVPALRRPAQSATIAWDANAARLQAVGIEVDFVDPEAWT
jgi:hypothetical protein